MWVNRFEKKRGGGSSSSCMQSVLIFNEFFLKLSNIRIAFSVTVVTPSAFSIINVTSFFNFGRLMPSSFRAHMACNAASGERSHCTLDIVTHLWGGGGLILLPYPALWHTIDSGTHRLQ